MTIIFNEQIVGDDGSLTVNAVHVKPNALVGKGDIVLAQAKCGPVATSAGGSRSGSFCWSPVCC